MLTFEALREAREYCETNVLPHYEVPSANDLARALLRCDLRDAEQALAENDLVRGIDSLTRLNEWIATHKARESQKEENLQNG